MVGPGNSTGWQQVPRQRPQSPLHPVADDGIADFLGDGETDANRHIVIPARVDQQYESGSRNAAPAIGSQKIPPRCQDGNRGHNVPRQST